MLAFQTSKPTLKSFYEGLFVSNVDILSLLTPHVLNWFLLQLSSMSEKSYIHFFVQFYIKNAGDKLNFL